MATEEERESLKVITAKGYPSGGGCVGLSEDKLKPREWSEAWLSGGALAFALFLASPNKPFHIARKHDGYAQRADTQLP